MIYNRVTLDSFYRQTQLSMTRRQRELARLNEQSSSGLRVNRPSDDPVASVSVQDSLRTITELEQYSTNLDTGRTWLQQTESSLSSMSDIISMLRERAEQLATGTYTAEERGTLADEVAGYLDELISLANTEVGGSYIFSGTRTDTKAATSLLKVENPAEADAGNAGPGSLWGQGAYTGSLSRDITLTVQSFGSGATSATPGGGETMTLAYSYVDDDGRTVSGTVEVSGTGTGYGVDLGDGVQVYAEDAKTAGGSYTVGDTFTLEVGRNTGNEEELSLNLSTANSMVYNYTLDDLFGVEGVDGDVRANLLDTISAWVTYLKNDSSEQDYYVSLAGGLNATDATVVNNPNHPSSTADMLVDGDWTQYLVGDDANPGESVAKYESADEYFADLNAWDLEYNVGSPVSITSGDLDDATLDSRQFRFFLDETTNADYDGIPSADNPMTLRVAYFDAGVGDWVDGGTVTVTGTGRESTFSFTDPVDGVSDIELYVADMSFISEDIVPADADANIDAWDGTGSPDPVTDDKYFSPLFYDPGTDPEETPVQVTVTYDTENGRRAYQTVTISGTGADQSVGVDLDGVGWDTDGDGVDDQFFDDVYIYLSDDGVVAGGDYYRTTLEQYHKGQEASQAMLGATDDDDGVTDALEMLTTLESAQSNLLRYVADAGGRLNRLDVRENVLGSENLRLYDRLEATQDADLTTVVTELTTYQTMYQASLQATVLLTNTTLADYL